MPAGDRYVNVPAAAMFSFLEGKGFSRREDRAREVIYQRTHAKDPRYKVLVYTSVARHEMAARRLGGDAIRVVVIFEDTHRSYGIAKLPRVFRTGTVEGVLERTIERAREAYAICNARVRGR